MAERMTGSLNCLPREAKPFTWRIGAGQFQFVGPLAFNGFFPEEFDRADGLGRGLARGLLFGFKVNEVLADLFGGEQIGRRVVGELGELADTGVVSLFGAWADGQELEVIGEGF